MLKKCDVKKDENDPSLSDIDEETERGKNWFNKCKYFLQDINDNYLLFWIKRDGHDSANYRLKEESDSPHGSVREIKNIELKDEGDLNLKKEAERRGSSEIIGRQISKNKNGKINYNDTSSDVIGHSEENKNELNIGKIK